MLREILILIFVVNASLLILHEIESAFEREWEILKLPGGISGFLLFHIPILFFLLYGLLLLERNSPAGLYFSVIAGIGGLVPLAVHKGLLRRAGRFDRVSSDILLVANALTGICLGALSLVYYGSIG